MISPPRLALGLFRPIAHNYERWASILSLGQDGRWRRRLVAGLGARPGSLILDVAAGTGSITRSLLGQGHRVVALDQSEEMIGQLDAHGALRLLATAETLPFQDEAFDALTAGYLLRYVEDLPSAMRELTRVIRPGGTISMLEFGRPTGVWGPLWWLYTRIALPVAGAVIGHGWGEVGRFLGPSIDGFWSTYSLDDLTGLWGAAGLEVQYQRMSLGGGVVIRGVKQ
ncbi:MAG: class I SAM-dependent methyltransferase [Actinomycetota bacterium]|nr:class I SAM-dependent methyltransferase [Actinomycetota bacterium]